MVLYDGRDIIARKLAQSKERRKKNNKGMTLHKSFPILNGNFRGATTVALHTFFQGSRDNFSVIFVTSNPSKGSRVGRVSLVPAGEPAQVSV